MLKHRPSPDPNPSLTLEMNYATTFPNFFACLSRFSEHRRREDLPNPSSPNISALLARFGAASLLIASAGLGATYAWQTGAHHGVLLGSLLVLFALGLEALKPLSISYAFDAFRQWKLVQGAALTILGLVAVGYSLSAQLSLVSTSRFDVVAERLADTDKARKASERYDRSRLELLTLEPAKPKAELDEQILSLLAVAGTNNCEKIDGPVTQRLCPKVAALKIEASRAGRREKLEATMLEAEKEAAKVPAASSPDPAAAALVVYLALVGMVVDPTLLSNLIVLVAVVALEVGSALSLVMVRAVSPGSVNRQVQEVKAEVVQPPLSAPLVQVVHAEAKLVSEDAETAREDVKRRVLTHLKTSGGRVVGSQRGLAKLINADKTTMRRAINSLTMAGIVAMEATRNGTMLRLVS